MDILFLDIPSRRWVALHFKKTRPLLLIGLKSQTVVSLETLLTKGFE